MPHGRRGGHSIRIHAHDLLFLEEEALRLRRERFRQDRNLASPSLADVLSQLLRELEEHRRRSGGPLEAG